MLRRFDGRWALHPSVAAASVATGLPTTSSPNTKQHSREKRVRVQLWKKREGDSGCCSGAKGETHHGEAQCLAASTAPDPMNVDGYQTLPQTQALAHRSEQRTMLQSLIKLTMRNMQTQS